MLVSVDFSGQLDIEYASFRECTSIEDVAICGVQSQNSELSIGEQAFNGCKNLRNVYLEAKSIYVGDMAFSDCTGLSSIAFSCNELNIENAIFVGCPSLSHVKLPPSLNQDALKIALLES